MFQFITNSALWCILQASLVALTAVLLTILAQRIARGRAASIPSLSLFCILLLTIVSLVPWSNFASAMRTNNSETPEITRGDSATLASSSEDFYFLLHNLWPLGDNTAVADNALTPSKKNAATVGKLAMAEPLSWRSVLQGTWRVWTHWSWLVVTVLLLGILLGGIRFVVGLLAVRKLHRNCSPIVDRTLLEQLDCVRAELRCTAPIALGETNELQTPATFGWRKPVILLPRAWRQWTDDQRQAVLAHEVAHITRGDYLKVLLAQLSLVVHFYHPLMHWLVEQMRQEQEWRADAAAAKVMGGERHYLRTLAELALQNSERSLGWPAQAFLPTPGTFLRRIEMLRDLETSPTSWLQTHLPRWLALTGVVLVTTLVGSVRPPQSSMPFLSGNSLSAQDTGGGQPGAENKSEGAADKTVADKPVQKGFDYRHIPNRARALFIAKPREMLELPVLATFAKQQQADMPEQHIEKGLNFTRGIEQFAVFILEGMPVREIERDPIIVIKFSSAAKMKEAIAVQPQYNLVPLDETSYIQCTPEMLQAYQQTRKGAPRFVTRPGWKKANPTLIAMAVEHSLLFEAFSNSPAAAMGLTPLWDDVDNAFLGAGLQGENFEVRLVLESENAEQAKQVEETAQAAIVLGKNALKGMVDNAKNTHWDIIRPLIFHELLTKAAANVKLQADDSLVTITTSVVPKVSAEATSELAKALKQSSARNVSQNNLKQIMLAFHNYSDTYGGGFPKAAAPSRDGQGQHPHSWRVAILPYIEQAELYNQYKFDEPWDSESNKKLIAKMPAIYRHPFDKKDSTNASYFAITGSTTVFDPAKPVKFADIPDGMSNTIGIVEAKRDIPWTKPDDIPFDPTKPVPELGGWFIDGWNVGFCDGSVRFMSKNVDQNTLKLLFQKSDGTPIPNF